MNTEDIGNNSIDSDKISWPARKITIGDSKDNNSISYQVGAKIPIGKGQLAIVSSILVDKKNHIYIVSVEHQTNKEFELVWKEIIKPTKTVEIEYDVSKEAYPNESIKE